MARFPHSPTKVIHVAGSDDQIGESHYEQLGSPCISGVQAFLYKFLNDLTARKYSGPFTDRLTSHIRFALRESLYRLYKRNLSQSVYDRIEGMTKAANVAVEDTLRAVITPDILPTLNSLMYRMSRDRFSAATFPNILACSSFVYPQNTAFIGRNLDFPGVGYWDRYPVIQLTKRKNKIPHIDFTTAGCPFGGITGINEEKIYVALHQHYGAPTHLAGELPFVIGERLLENARSLADAKNILVRSQSATSWAYIVADGKTGDAFICEKTPKSMGFRPLSTEPLCHTNKFLTEECIPHEFAMSERMNWDTTSRKLRLEQVLKNQTLDTQGAVDLLGDHHDPYLQKTAVAGRTISTAHNIQSILLDTENMHVYFAEGFSPIHLSAYRKYDLQSIFDGNEGLSSERITPSLSNDSSFLNAREAYSLSFIQSMNGEYHNALSNLNTACEYDSNAHLEITRAQILMRLNRSREALTHLRTAKSMLFDLCVKEIQQNLPPEYYELILWQIRACELDGQNADEFRSELRGTSKVKDRFLKNQALNKKKYTLNQHLRKQIGFSLFLPH